MLSSPVSVISVSPTKVPLEALVSVVASTLIVIAPAFLNTSYSCGTLTSVTLIFPSCYMIFFSQ